jgi:hypothetical protein
MVPLSERFQVVAIASLATAARAVFELATTLVGG